MNAVIRRWGHSKAIRLPKSILEIAGLEENDQVYISATEKQIIIKQDKKHKHTPLKERLANFQGRYVCSEWNSGSLVGEEVI